MIGPASVTLSASTQQRHFTGSTTPEKQPPNGSMETKPKFLVPLKVRMLLVKNFKVFDVSAEYESLRIKFFSLT